MLIVKSDDYLSSGVSLDAARQVVKQIKPFLDEPVREKEKEEEIGSSGEVTNYRGGSMGERSPIN